MDKQTAKKAVDKLNAMKEFIAYPDEYMNKSIIDDYYKGKPIKIKREVKYKEGNNTYTI